MGRGGGGVFRRLESNRFQNLAKLQTQCLQVGEKIHEKLVGNFPCRNPEGKEET